jgi:hypothetical protein
MLGMLDKKDKLAALIVGGPKESDDKESSMDMKSEAKKDSMRQFLAAVEKKDLSAMDDALDMYLECRKHEGSEEDSDD